MRNLFAIFVSLLTYFTCSAQDPQLFENTWYLHDLIIGGQSNVPPINNEIPFVPADFIEPDLFETGMCGSLGSGTILYSGTNEFNFPNGITWFGCGNAK